MYGSDVGKQSRDRRTLQGGEMHANVGTNDLSFKHSFTACSKRRCRDSSQYACCRDRARAQGPKNVPKKAVIAKSDPAEISSCKNHNAHARTQALTSSLVLHMQSASPSVHSKRRDSNSLSFSAHTQGRKKKRGHVPPIPQLRSIFSRKIAIGRKDGWCFSTGPGTEDYPSHGITLSKPP